ncbi:MAG: hypothetical protein EOO89_22580 [Pedobacter sp.]|nr:MAG: hypothetical protein EOO89_22580 [Pedobacter sp.]
MGLLFDGSNMPISNTNPLPVMMTGGGASAGNSTVTAVPQDGTVVTGAPFSGNVNGTVLFSIDTTGYESISVQLYGTFTATVTYEMSNDNTNWLPIQGTNMSNVGGVQVGSTDNGAVWAGTNGGGLQHLKADGSYTTYTHQPKDINRLATILDTYFYDRVLLHKHRNKSKELFESEFNWNKVQRLFLQKVKELLSDND